MLPTLPRPWRDFAVLSLAEWAACTLSAVWIAGHVHRVHVLEVFTLTYAAATLARYLLRRHLLRDIRGLRQPKADADVNSTAQRKAA
jgi:hypothetical protein